MASSPQLRRYSVSDITPRHLPGCHDHIEYTCTDLAELLGKKTSFNYLNFDFPVNRLKKLDQIDAYQGFSNSLLLLVNNICDLASYHISKAGHGSEENCRLAERVKIICNNLEDLTQLAPQPHKFRVEPLARALVKALSNMNSVQIILLK